ncbi:MAG: TIGR02452 family protein, partial [Coriobacteriaceae bacterium]|nr:TIGR02452 family protein [Coriobacteriaceae bacterium]
MPSKEERQAEAKKHIALMKSVFSAETDAAIKSAKFYEDGEGRELPIPEPRFEATATEVTTDFMVTALYKHKGTVALVDPAAFSKPAGGYEEGSFGPEQALCSESNLYPVLSGLKKEYYDKNRGFASGQIYNDHAMYLSDVTFTRNGSIRKAGVVVIAAPNR